MVRHVLYDKITFDNTYINHRGSQDARVLRSYHGEHAADMRELGRGGEEELHSLRCFREPGGCLALVKGKVGALICYALRSQVLLVMHIKKLYRPRKCSSPRLVDKDRGNAIGVWSCRTWRFGISRHP